MKPYSILLLAVILWAGCKESAKRRERKPDYNIGPVTDPKHLKQAFYDASDKEHVKIKQGDSSLIVLNYIYGKYLFDIQNVYNSKTGFKINIGEYNALYPSAFFILPSEENRFTRSYHFFNPTGVITRIATQNDHTYEGPYYEFDSDGAMVVSGFYNKDGYPTKIWRLYNNKGEILETIKADTTKINILKKFGRE